jgi:hypothetical protein
VGVFVTRVIKHTNTSKDHIDNERGAAERKMLADMKLLHQNQHPLDYREDDGATAVSVLVKFFVAR